MLMINLGWPTQVMQMYFTVVRLHICWSIYLNTIWAQRELGTLADMLSKNELAQFFAALSARGYPQPHEDMFVRRPWYL